MSKDKQPVSRRLFVKLGLGTVAAWLTGCAAENGPPPTPTPPPTDPLPAPTSTPLPATATLPPPSPTNTRVLAPISSPSPTYTPVLATPTQPPPATATPQPLPDRTELMGHWPATETSRVVVVRATNPDIAQMLDTGLTTLTGLSDPLTVLGLLFGPDEQILLKVNCISYGGPSQPEVTYALAQRLQEAGIPAENLLIFDRTDHELEAAGYTLNEGGGGVQCHGSRGEGPEISLSQANIRLYQEIEACDALINLPIPKQHGMAGISVSMKNHYGSVNSPGRLHGNRCDPAIAELNNQPAIRDKTRLIVGTALQVSPCDWNQPETENALLFSFDSVALDTVGRDILVRHRQQLGLSADHLIAGAPQLETAQSLQLGTTDPARIELLEVTL